jgi:hypothetical protein
VDRENAVREFTANVLSEKKAPAPIATRRSARAARSMPASVLRLATRGFEHPRLGAGDSAEEQTEDDGFQPVMPDG